LVGLCLLGGCVEGSSGMRCVFGGLETFQPSASKSPQVKP
jgi:hypothetical protein